MPTPTPPPPQVQPVPSVAQLSAKPSGHRGLYMTIGAALVLVVLVAAGIYIPRRNKTGASEQSNTTEQQTPVPAPASANPVSSDANSQTNPASAPQAETANPTANPPAEETQPATPASDTGPNSMAAPPAASAPAPVVNAGKRNRASSASASQSTQESAASQAEADAAAQAQAANAAQLEELEQQVDQLSSRASAVNNSLDTLRQQQSSQGYGLRGDIASTQEMMKTHLAKAQQALQNQDAKSAKKYSDMAEAELATLEHFLGH
jgi:hypothetical protein